MHYYDHVPRPPIFNKVIETKKEDPNGSSYAAYDVVLRCIGRSTHQQVPLRKTCILFYPNKKANAKKVAPAKRGKKPILQSR